MFSCQDRTNDFNQIICHLKTSSKAKQNGYIVKQSKVNSKRNQLINERSQFTNAAKHMTDFLAGTCARLERLSSLVKTTSLFDDKSDEIHRLTTMVKEDMANLTQEMGILQSLYTNQNVSNGTQSSSHSRSIVQSIQSRLNGLSTSFNNTLQNRVASLKTQAQRREIFSQPLNLNKGMERRTLESKKIIFQPKMPSLLLEEEEMSKQSDSSSLKAPVSNPMFSQQMSLIDRTDDYLESRNESIRDVERTIVDMGKIFEQLSILIHEQGEQVDMIHGHVEETSINVESGHKELLKLYQSVTSNRWLMFKVFGVLSVFVIIFVVLLA